MAHFVILDKNNIVTDAIVVSNEAILDENGIESEAIGIAFCKSLFGGNWIQTSYNGSIRGVFAGVGYSYNKEEDIFVCPQPFESWVRDGSNWNPPIPKPDDGLKYQWNEENGLWDVIS